MESKPRFEMFYKGLKHIWTRSCINGRELMVYFPYSSGYMKDLKTNQTFRVEWDKNIYLIKGHRYQVEETIPEDDKKKQ